MQNDTEISGAVAFESDGVVWQAATGLKYFAYETHDVRNVSAELESSAFKLNDTFSRAHYFSAATTKENFCRFGEWIVYTGGSGIFAYSLKSAAIVPVLLDTTNIRYRYPVALTDGSLFVVGLTSESGVVGADGPVYEVDLRAALAQ